MHYDSEEDKFSKNDAHADTNEIYNQPPQHAHTRALTRLLEECHSINFIKDDLHYKLGTFLKSYTNIKLTLRHSHLKNKNSGNLLTSETSLSFSQANMNAHPTTQNTFVSLGNALQVCPNQPLHYHHLPLSHNQSLPNRALQLILQSCVGNCLLVSFSNPIHLFDNWLQALLRSHQLQQFNN